MALNIVSLALASEVKSLALEVKPSVLMLLALFDLFLCWLD